MEIALVVVIIVYTVIVSNHGIRYDHYGHPLLHSQRSYLGSAYGGQHFRRRNMLRGGSVTDCRSLLLPKRMVDGRDGGGTSI
ncbi:hypothetical protein C8Q72DRAFT_813880 [Fomitopsis betulina]|nr:hypothetical protein C8Q72DRAFT_813880 [Fomitopsis betulina]